jgi:agmatine deiminase
MEAGKIVYFSDLLPVKYPQLSTVLQEVLHSIGVQTQLVERTKDIWIRDYMPVRINDSEFVSFNYDPDYLRVPRYQNLRTEFRTLGIELKGKVRYSDIILDGGNVERFNRTAFLVDKCFDENPAYTVSDLETELRHILDVDQLHFLPWDKSDIIGHIDGILRFYDSNTVILNDYRNDNNPANKNIHYYIKSLGYDLIELPYNPYRNKSDLDATGVYTNYIHVNDAILLPVFNQAEDARAIDILKELYGHDQVFTINCEQLAKEGGLLNCVTWL